MCTGLLSQVVSTLPLTHNATGWFVADIDTEPFAPERARAFVRAVRERGRACSPLGATADWRHVPSYSA
eukprot:518044-Rhodomonas_salina.1